MDKRDQTRDIITKKQEKEGRKEGRTINRITEHVQLLDARQGLKLLEAVRQVDIRTLPQIKTAQRGHSRGDKDHRLGRELVAVAQHLH